MTMTYKAVTGRVTIPGTDLAPGGRLRVTATPMSTDGVLTFAGERATFGPRSVETDAAGYMPTGSAALKIPQGSSLGAELAWKITAEPIDRASTLKKWTVTVAPITADITIQELAHPDLTVVSPELATTVGENAAAAATSATAAAGSATAASTSATSAATAKTAAETARDAAATSATAAAGSATSASTSAGTATTKAGEAATSASNAATSATAAGTAKTAAETARDAAQTAKSAAETARTGAESAAASVPGSWQPGTFYTANSNRVAPDGSMISRNTDGTSRATYDSTEQAAWTPVLAKTGTQENSALNASTDARVADPASPAHQTIQGIALVNALVYGG